MLKNYLKIAVRNLRKHKGYAFINIFGLAVGLAVCLLIVLYVRDELSYDRFHDNAEEIYRIVRQEGELTPSVTPAVPLAPALIEAYPEVLQATRLFRYWSTPLLSRGEEGFYEERFFFTDNNFLDVFSFPLSQGDPASALEQPFSLLLTESAAHRYFGEEDPVGQTITLNAQHVFTITGVLQDVPRTSHVTFDFLASLESAPVVTGRTQMLESWGLGSFPTYVVLPAGHDPALLDAKLANFAPPETNIRYFLQPLTDIHLYSNYRGEIEANSDIRYVYLLAGVALIILLLACINYTNLATARFTQRALEVGIRKVIGAHRKQLTLQFLGESLFLAFIAMLGAIALLELMLPAFSNLIDGTLTLDYTRDYAMLAMLGGIAMFAGLVAGGYPAFYLAAFQPGAVLKGARDGASRTPLRKVLVVTQYAMAVVLVAGAGVIYQQLDYMQSKKLGFDKEQVVVVPIRDEQVKERPEVAKAAFLELPEVTQVSASSSAPGSQTSRTTLRPLGALRDEPFQMYVDWIDADYVETMDIEMVAGRDFSNELATDAEETLIINETAVRELGWATPEEALGQSIAIWGENRNIIGVTRDFHFQSLHSAINPLLFFPEVDQSSGLILRLRTDDLAATMTRLEASWKQLSASQPFNYSFLDQDLEKLYSVEQRWGTVIGSAAMLALLIACLGLFGLASFMAEQRTKEIGVRKVLGASAFSIAVLLSNDFARLVGVAFVLGAPVAYFAAQRWLEGFAYHIEISVWVFLVAGLLALGIALLTVSYQSIKAALSDPVKSLRYE